MFGTELAWCWGDFLREEASLATAPGSGPSHGGQRQPRGRQRASPDLRDFNHLQLRRLLMPQ